MILYVTYLFKLYTTNIQLLVTYMLKLGIILSICILAAV